MCFNRTQTHSHPQHNTVVFLAFRAEGLVKDVSRKKMKLKVLRQSKDKRQGGKGNTGVCTVLSFTPILSHLAELATSQVPCSCKARSQSGHEGQQLLW
ncbi:hypothetical protein QQF64_025285 [Cirrhinus molitorella]|uniref:Uncharacterized protein n=1 Tax=Cirrhinus molitorella TaxID=172907 RepID=A0ABR3NNL7_9TELE